MKTLILALTAAAALAACEQEAASSAVTPSSETKTAALGANAQPGAAVGSPSAESAAQQPSVAAGEGASASNEPGGAGFAPKQGGAVEPPPSAGSPPRGAEGRATETRGTMVEQEAFRAWLQSSGEAKAGETAPLEAVVVAKGSYHINAEYPHKFKLGEPPQGLSYPQSVVRGMKTTPERGVLAIPVKAESAGTSEVTGKLSFSVCTEERCLVEKQDLSLALIVK